MRTVTMIKSAVIMLLAGLWLCQSAFASLGLGEARVQSFLGQELEVDIALVRSEETSVDSLQVAVADVADYGRLGVPADALSLGLSVTLDQSVDPPLIRLRSDRAVEEPFVQVLVDARWASGRILREYTLFIDPPAVPVAPPIRRPQETEPVPEAPLPPVAVQSPEDGEISQEPQRDLPAQADDVPEQADREAESVQQDDNMSAPEAPESAGPDSLVAESGDTLWSIASDWRPGDLTMHQAMLSIFERNPEAFMGDNINRLRRGARLVLPAADDVRALPPEEATRRFQEQVRAWEASRAAPVAPPPPEPVPAPAPEPAPEPESVIEPELVEDQTDGATEEVAPQTPENETISPAEEVVAEQVGAGLPAQPRLELTPPDEDLMTEAATIGAERDRLSAQLDELQSQIAQEGLENAEMNSLVDQARQAIESADAGGMMVASEDLARLEAQLREAREIRAAEQEAAEIEAAEVLVEPQNQVSDTVRAAPEASFLERWMWPLVAVGGGLLLLMTLIGIRRSRSASADEQAASENERTAPDSQDPVSQDVVSDRDDLKDSEDPVAAPGPANSQDDENERDAEAALMGILDRSEDDEDDHSSAPKTETEAYQADFEGESVPDEDEEPDLARLSNRLEQDEGDLAIDKHEDDEKPHLPAGGPETVALEDEDYEALFASDDDVNKDADAFEEEPGSLTLDFDLPEDEADEETGEARGEFGASTSPFEIDVEKDAAIEEKENLENPGEENEWFALDEADKPVEETGSADEPGADQDAETAEVEDKPSEETAGLADEDAEVKLDLARAYISMEDPGSARVLLEEVVNDGSPDHREQAQKLMDSLR